MSIPIPVLLTKKDNKNDLVNRVIEKLRVIINQSNCEYNSSELSSNVFQLVQQGCHKQLFEAITKEFYRKCQKILIELKNYKDISFAHQFTTLWAEYYRKVTIIESLCSIVNHSVFMLTDKEYHSLKEISLKLFYEMIYVSNASEIVKYISALTYHLENVRSDYLPKESINPLPEGIDVMMELDRLECFYNESDTFIANTDLYDSVYVNTLLQLKRPLYEGVFQYYSQGKDSVQFFNQMYVYIQEETKLLERMVKRQSSCRSIVELLYKLILFNYDLDLFNYANGYFSMYDQKLYSTLQKIDELYMHNERGKYLYKTINAAYLQKQCYALLTTSKNPVPEFFNYLSSMVATYTESFKKNVLLINTILEAKTNLVNKYPALLDQFLYYLHQCIIQKDQEKIQQFRSEMDAVFINLFNKELFMQLYRCYLYYRYCFTCFDYKYEYDLFQSINALIPFSNFHNIIYLFNDIQAKKTVAKAMQKYNVKKRISFSNAISLTSINKESYNAFDMKEKSSDLEALPPQQTSPHKNLSHFLSLYLPSLDIYIDQEEMMIPSSLSSDLQQLEKSYNELYINKKCAIYPQYLQMKIQACYPSGVYTLYCTHYQGAMFMAINEYLLKKKNQPCSLSELYLNAIQKRMKIELSVFMAILKSFLSPIPFYSCNEQNIQSLTETNTIQLISNFQRDEKTISVLPLSLEDLSTDSNAPTAIQSEINNEDQQYLYNNISTIIDALIVHHLKIKKEIQFEDLKTYIQTQYFKIYHGTPFDLDEPIKREIDVLIDREFIYRDDSDEDLLIYVD